MSVQRAQYEIPSSEFIDWIVYLDKEINGFHREDFFLATVAAEIRRSWVKDPAKVKMKDFMLKFEGKEKKKKMTKEESTTRAKAFWGIQMMVPQKPKGSV